MSSHQIKISKDVGRGGGGLPFKIYRPKFTVYRTEFGLGVADRGQSIQSRTGRRKKMASPSPAPWYSTGLSRTGMDWAGLENVANGMHICVTCTAIQEQCDSLVRSGIRKKSRSRPEGEMASFLFFPKLDTPTLEACAAWMPARSEEPALAALEALFQEQVKDITSQIC